MAYELNELGGSWEDMEVQNAGTDNGFAKFTCFELTPFLTSN
jgi:hypothetical protein